MEKTGVAIIGCGAIFPVHAEVVSELNQTDLLLVVDSDSKKAEWASAKFGCRYHTDYRIILDDSRINVVHLCTPHYLHGPMSMELMRAGKHILTEKPMGMNVDECRSMNRVSTETERYLGVCFQNRYHDTSVKMKQVLESGSMGRIIGARAFVTWMRDKNYYDKSSWRGVWDKEGGSLLMNQAIHTLDLLQWFLGDIEQVHGSVACHFLSETIETEDTAEAFIVFKSGARALFYASNAYVSNAPVHIEIICEKGTMILGDVLIMRWSDGRVEEIRNEPAAGEKSYWGTGHKNLIKDFYDCIRKNKNFPVNGTEGIKTIEMIHQLYKKVRRCSW